MNILILGARSPICLEWSRALTKEGHHVFAADCLLYPLGRFSNSVRAYYRLPSPKFSYQQWLSDLIEIVQAQKIDVIIPLCEEAFYLSFSQATLAKYCSVFVADFLLMTLLHDKALFADFSQKLTIKAPHTLLIHDWPTLQSTLTQINRPIILKPVFSRFANHIYINPRIEALKEDELQPCFPFVIQDFIEGTEYCSYSILDKGRLLMHSCYRPTYRAGQGAGLYLIPENMPNITEFVRDFGQKTGYTGQVGFDFIKDNDNTLWVLECNPRGTSGIHLLKNKHHELAQTLFQADSFLQPVIADIEHAITFKFAFVLLHLLRYAYSWKQLKQNLSAYQQSVDAIFSQDDLKPCLLQGLMSLETCYIAQKNHLSIWEASTLDIEWNGHTI